MTRNLRGRLGSRAGGKQVKTQSLSEVQRQKTHVLPGSQTWRGRGAVLHCTCSCRLGWSSRLPAGAVRLHLQQVQTASLTNSPRLLRGTHTHSLLSGSSFCLLSLLHLLKPTARAPCFRLLGFILGMDLVHPELQRHNSDPRKGALGSPL